MQPVKIVLLFVVGLLLGSFANAQAPSTCQEYLAQYNSGYGSAPADMCPEDIVTWLQSMDAGGINGYDYALQIYKCSSTYNISIPVVNFTGSDGISCQFQTYYLMCDGIDYPSQQPSTIPLGGCTTFKYLNQSPPDLRVDSLSISPSSVAPDGVTSLKPGDVEVGVVVHGTNIPAEDSRQTLITLTVGNQQYVESVPLSDVATGTTVTFTVTIQPTDAGDLYFSATIDPNNLLGDPNLGNNVAAEKTHVLCSVADKGTDVPFLSQVDPRWAAETYDHTNSTMGALGCLVSDLAMLMRSYGITKTSDGGEVTPQTVNSGLNNQNFGQALGNPQLALNGYGANGDVQPQGFVLFARATYANWCASQSGNASECLGAANNKISFKGSTNKFDLPTANLVNSEICNGNPVILRTVGHSLGKSHFVIATGFTVDAQGNGQYIVNDPGKSQGQQIPLDPFSVTGARGYRPASDPDMMFFHVSDGVDMIVTDPMGRRAGYDPVTNTTYEEIPGGNYIRGESIDSPDGDVSTPPETRFEAMTPVSGAYQVQFISTSNTSFHFETYGFDMTGAINSGSQQSGTLKANTPQTITVQHSANPVTVNREQIQISQADYYDTRHKDWAFVEGKVTESNGTKLPSLKGKITVAIGSFSRTFDLRSLMMRRGPDVVYHIENWGRNGLAFELNERTGQFWLFVENKNLPLGNLSTELPISMTTDQIAAKGTVKFKVKTIKGKAGKINKGKSKKCNDNRRGHR